MSTNTFTAPSKYQQNHNYNQLGIGGHSHQCLKAVLRGIMTKWLSSDHNDSVAWVAFENYVLLPICRHDILNYLKTQKLEKPILQAIATFFRVHEKLMLLEVDGYKIQHYQGEDFHLHLRSSQSKKRPDACFMDTHTDRLFIVKWKTGKRSLQYIQTMSEYLVVLNYYELQHELYSSQKEEEMP